MSYVYPSPKERMERTASAVSKKLWALGIWGAMLLASMAANAQSISPFFTYQGRAFEANGTTPLTHTVSFKVQIRSANSACLLYEEQQNGVNLATTNGLFNLSIGSATGDSKRTGDDAGLTMARIFSNTGTVRSADATFCPGGYAPTSGDKRRLRVMIIDGATTTTLTPDQDVVTTPYATVAETLQGITPSGFIQVTGAVTQADLNAVLLKKTELLSLASIETTLTALAAGSSSLYIKPSAGGANLSGTGDISLSAQKSLQLGGYTSAQQTTLVSGLGASDKGKTWFNTSDNQMYYWDGSAARAVGTSSAISNVTASAPLSATGTTSIALSLQTGAGLTTSGGNLVPDFGTASGKVAQGNDSRFNPSFVAGDADKFVQINGTGTSYILRTASEMRTALGLGASSTLAVGTTSSTVAAGDDSRIVGALPKAGGTMTGALTLATGTTTLSPLVIPAGTLKTTPAAGDFEFNGTTFFFTNGSNVRQRVSSYDASLTPSNGDALIWNGSAWAPGAVSSGTLPDATGSTKGGVIVGTGLNVSSGTISVAYGTGSGTAVQGNDARMNPAPAVGTAANYVRVNAGGTAYENRTAAQTVTDLGLGAVASLGIGTGLTSGSGNLKADFAPSTSTGLPTGTSKVVADDHYRLNPTTVLGDANKMIRVNATGSGYELRTATEVKSDLGLGTAAGYNVGTGNGNIPQLDGSGKLASSVLPSTYSNFQSTGFDDNASSTAMTIDSAGKVGIGTASPGAELEVASSNASPNIRLTSSGAASASYPGISIWTHGGSNGGGGLFGFYTSRGTSAAPAATQAGDEIGALQAHGYGTSWGGAVSAVNFTADSTFTATSKPTRIGFYTTNVNETGGSERMRISPEGYVGVGTTAPTSLLTVSSNTTAPAAPKPGNLIHIAAADSVTTRATLDGFAAGPVIHFRRANNTAASPTALAADDLIGTLNMSGYTGSAFSNSRAAVSGYASEAWSTSANGTYLVFNTTANGTTTTTERMRVDNAGNVGIGVTSPASTLDVAGGIKLANDTATCDATKYGTLRYASNVVELCNSSGWIGIASTGTGASTSGNNTFSGSNTYSGSSTFTGAASFSSVGPSPALDVTGGGLQSSTLNVTSTSTFAGNMNVDSGTFYVDSSGDKVGVGVSSSLGAKMTVRGAAGVPATTGTTQGGIFRVEQGTSNNVMDFGSIGISPWTTWIQSTNRGDLSVNNPLALNPNGGNVGIGTSSPSAKLHVAGGQILATNSSGIVEVNTAASIDWDKGNVQTLTTADCASTTFTNMLDGGTYTLVIKETGTTTCAFSHSGLTFHLPPDHGARTSAKHTVYTFLRAGTDVYASWIPGF